MSGALSTIYKAGMRRSCFVLLMLLVLGCGDDSPSNKGSAATEPPAADPCVAVRAEYFRQEQWLLMSIGAAGGGGPNDPYARRLLANYKLENPTCFF